jgi:hypothetical protein
MMARTPSLPTFLIGGERRSGTTTLYNELQAHPDIFLYPKPDYCYFVEDELSSRQWFDGGVDASAWEATHNVEDYAEQFRAGAGKSAVGHKGADLLFWKPAHSRIARFVPGVKILITLRNPVSRAWSHYWNEVGKGRETLEFDEALAAEGERCERSAFARFHLSYLQRGFYAQNLRTLFASIPQHQVMVITVEQSRLRREDTLSEIYRFIGVDPTQGLTRAGQVSNENWTMVPRTWARRPGIRSVEQAYLRMTEGVTVRVAHNVESRRRLRRITQSLFRRPASGIAMPERLRARLRETYLPHVRDLESMLGRTMDEWSL